MFCIIFGCVYSQIKIRNSGDKKFPVFTAGSIICPISRGMGVINEFGFRCFASFLDEIRKIGKKNLFVFTAGSIFWPISRVMGVIDEFDLRCFA